MRSKFIEFLGWYGTAAILGAYAFVSFGVIVPTDPIFQILNASGALGIVAVSLANKAFQPAVLNVIWAVIAVVAILKLIFS